MKVSFVQKKGFTSAGSNLWNLACKHQSSKKHIANQTAYQLLGNTDIACALDEARQRNVERHNLNASHYTIMMHHHIDAAVFLTAQGLAFRGHDESLSSSNRGNFLELMDLIGGYSYDLKSFLDKEQIIYTSHEPQNQLIDCMAEEVPQEIQRRIDNSRFVGIMMDDTSDCSNVEQSAVSIRIVYNGLVEEHLLGLIDASKDQSADGLTKILIEMLEKHNIVSETAKERLIGQSYDGAPSMSGQLNGVQSKYRQYFHMHIIIIVLRIECPYLRHNQLTAFRGYRNSLGYVRNSYRSSEVARNAPVI